jgi:hypothetical protein
VNSFWSSFSECTQTIKTQATRRTLKEEEHPIKTQGISMLMGSSSTDNIKALRE